VNLVLEMAFYKTFFKNLQWESWNPDAESTNLAQQVIAVNRRRFYYGLINGKPTLQGAIIRFLLPRKQNSRFPAKHDITN